MQHASGPAKTHSGTQPGVPVADVTFILCFAKATSHLRTALVSLGLLTKLNWSGHSFLHPAADGQKDEITHLAEASFADDLMLAMIETDNHAVIPRATLTFEI